VETALGLLALTATSQGEGGGEVQEGEAEAQAQEREWRREALDLAADLRQLVAQAARQQQTPPHGAVRRCEEAVGQSRWKAQVSLSDCNQNQVICCLLALVVTRRRRPDGW
jgi:hypothetical protein